MGFGTGLKSLFWGELKRAWPFIIFALTLIFLEVLGAAFVLLFLSFVFFQKWRSLSLFILPLIRIFAGLRSLSSFIFPFIHVFPELPSLSLFILPLFHAFQERRALSSFIYSPDGNFTMTKINSFVVCTIFKTDPPLHRESFLFTRFARNDSAS